MSDDWAFVLFWAWAALLVVGLVVGIVAVVGDSWAEMCVAQGGEYVHTQEQFPDNPNAWTDSERCDLP